MRTARFPATGTAADTDTYRRGRLAPPGCLRKLDLDIYTTRQFQFGERVDRLGRRSVDLDQTFVCAQLELLSRFLIYVRGPQDGKYFFLGGRRNRTGNDDPTVANSFNDFLR